MKTALGATFQQIYITTGKRVKEHKHECKEATPILYLEMAADLFFGDIDGLLEQIGPDGR
jgi:hypothetical protein